MALSNYGGCDNAAALMKEEVNDCYFFIKSGAAIDVISVFALVFRHAPLPTSPVNGGGAATPSPPAGRVGVGAMFKSLRKDTYQSRGQSL